MVCNWGSLNRCRTPLGFCCCCFCSVALSSISLKQERGSAEHTSKYLYCGQGGCGLPLGGSMIGSRNQTAIGLLAACPNRTSCKCKVKHWEWTNSNSTVNQHCFWHAMHTPTDLVAGNWHNWGSSWAWQISVMCCHQDPLKFALVVQLPLWDPCDDLLEQRSQAREDADLKPS